MHSCRDTKKLLKRLKKEGFTIEDKGDKTLVKAPNGEDQYLIHVGGNGKSYHPLRRWVKNVQK